MIGTAYNPFMGKIIDLRGRRFGRLTVISLIGVKNNHTLWNCLCDCGNKKVSHSAVLSGGKTRSCGCLHNEFVSRINLTHGLANKMPEYRIWKHLRGRCNNPKDSGYHHYGGRGIFVSDAWNDFRVFLKDMGSRPSPNHSIERKDNDGPYSGENCFWATRKQQSVNKRSTRRITIGKETLSLMEWCERFGINYGTAFNRLKNGWSAEIAVTTPARFRHTQT